MTAKIPALPNVSNWIRTKRVTIYEIPMLRDKQIKLRSSRSMFKLRRKMKGEIPRKKSYAALIPAKVNYSPIWWEMETN
jgi:hypothetical protein